MPSATPWTSPGSPTSWATCAGPARLAFLRFSQGQLAPLPSVAEAKAYPYTSVEREWIHTHRARSFVGSPDTVREQITRLAERAGVHEVMVTTMTHSHTDRRRSYILLAEAFAQGPAPAVIAGTAAGAAGH